MAPPNRMASSRKTLVNDDRDQHVCKDARTAVLRSTAAGRPVPWRKARPRVQFGNSSSVRGVRVAEEKAEHFA